MPDATSLHHCFQNHHQYCTNLLSAYLSVCHFFILEKASFSGLKLTSDIPNDDLCSTFLKIEAILEKKRVELWP